MEYQVNFWIDKLEDIIGNSQAKQNVNVLSNMSRHRVDYQVKATLDARELKIKMAMKNGTCTPLTSY